MTTNQKSTSNLKKKSKLSKINPDAAGIDIGSESHYVCVPSDRDQTYIRSFGSFTQDLYELSSWLKKCKIKTVAMESTSVYWIPLFQILEKQGFEVILVNARYVKNVPGRKTDVKDSQWLQQLHSYGLLEGSFRPDDKICVLRSYMRHRENLIKSATTHVHRMQKAIAQMNIKLDKVISDITGVTGMKIIRAILDGERDIVKLASLKDIHIKSSIDQISKALEGDYRKEHLFTLKHELESYEFYQQKVKECDKEIENYYKEFDQKGDSDTPKSTKRRRFDKNNPTFDVRKELYQITGIDFTQVPGLGVLTAQTIISEVGLDMSKWASEQHFTSWLGLCPSNKITGGKVFSTRTRKVMNRASEAFRMSAHAVGKTQTALGAFFRRIKQRAGVPKAITATARKLACIFYRLMKHGQAYVEEGIDYYEKHYTERVVKNLEKTAKKLGFALVKNELEEPRVLGVS